MKKKKTKVVDKIVEQPYKASIMIFGKVFSATGGTALEAIAGLNPGNVKGKSILIVEKGGVKKERVLMPRFTQRLFSLSGLAREIALKNASILFGGI